MVEMMAQARHEWINAAHRGRMEGGDQGTSCKIVQRQV